VLASCVKSNFTSGYGQGWGASGISSNWQDLLPHGGAGVIWSSPIYCVPVSEGGDPDGVIAIVMAMDPGLVEPTLALIRDTYGHPVRIEVVPSDLECIRSDAFRTDRRKLAHVVATFPGPSVQIIETLSDVDVAVLIWELDEHAFDVDEMFIRSRGEIRWRGHASKANAKSALYDYFAAMSRSGDERVAAVQRWRGAAEALLLELEVVLEEREALLAELRQHKPTLWWQALG
jgi:hypothetical protein